MCVIVEKTFSFPSFFLDTKCFLITINLTNRNEKNLSEHRLFSYFYWTRKSKIFTKVRFSILQNSFIFDLFLIDKMKKKNMIFVFSSKFHSPFVNYWNQFFWRFFLKEVTRLYINRIVPMEIKYFLFFLMSIEKYWHVENKSYGNIGSWKMIITIKKGVSRFLFYFFYF